jgi:alpha-ribazole phosphatase
MKLWLVRHARPLVNQGVCYGALDLLADTAATQALAQDLAQALPQGIAMASSPLQRCEHLAQHLCRLRADLAYVTDAALSEMNFGQWEGQAWDAIGAAALQAWTDDFMQHHPGGAESVAHMLERVGAALRAALSADQDVVWVTHAGVINTVRAWLEPLDAASHTSNGLSADWQSDSGLQPQQQQRPRAPGHARLASPWRLRAQAPQLRPQDWPRSAPLGSWEVIELQAESPR